MKKTLIILSSCALVASSAAAQPPVIVKAEPVPSKVVSFADLNIGSPSGQARLVHRIRAAAKDVCFEDNKADLKIEVARRGCYKTALSSGLDQMNQAVAAYQSGSSLAAATLIIRGE